MPRPFNIMCFCALLCIQVGHTICHTCTAGEDYSIYAQAIKVGMFNYMHSLVTLKYSCIPSFLSLITYLCI